MRALLVRPVALLALAALLLVALAWLRPLDHDESQYVAAAMFTARGLIPYRDYAYLQTPLQPFGLAPVALWAGLWTWPALRMANALFGALALLGVYRAARIGGGEARLALAGAGLFAACDILLFSAGTARNDALPAALLALALPSIVAAQRGAATRQSALIAGLLLSAAAAAKLSFALPALAYGLYALSRPGHRAGWVAIGALPMAIVTGWCWVAAPEAFLFEVFTFPARAPAEYYEAAGRAWKLGLPAKALDVLKFLALGPALPALGLLAATRRQRPIGALDVMIVAGLIAAVLPSPTWRQYLLPALPPLFVQLALWWQARPPSRAVRVAVVVFAVAGLAPSAEALVRGAAAPPLAVALADTRAVARAATGLDGLVVTLSPQFLAGSSTLPDPRFATGPFYFRSHGLLGPDEETRARLVSQDRLDAALVIRPAAVLAGGEGAWTSGDPALDAAVERWAAAHGYRRTHVGPRLRLWFRPP
ncbi:DUF2029 domain-containing protein [Sphingomonas aracearum]|uniref:DUF2029 domain-containing protein n=1 Tax=Sphingomonas aracearum TaxID=2283317 RepID=A0A369VXI3_9SPHN|nr:DUF2029 domain-containing protein [Sphingomonas aracearum]RDE04541.1 DUF2029 domain-containing protein [Sphingomonas aracearum]